jgi:4'-phosphopantetheinyl transferase
MNAPDLNWPAAPGSLPVGEDGITVFAASLSVSKERLGGLAATLSADERERADRLVSEIVRRRFITARGILREILGCRCNCPAAEIKFAYSPTGKPSLIGDSTLHFNLAHSHDLALVAVSRLALVGVDIELVRAPKDAEAVAERFFSPRESTGLKALPVDQRPPAFFNLWTRKEACVKATGEGVARAIQQVEVSFLPGEPARVISFRGDANEGRQWRLWSLDPAPGYIGALAAAVGDVGVALYSWEG